VVITDFSFHQVLLGGNCSCTQVIQSPGEDKIYFNVHECTATSEVKVLLRENRKSSLCSDETECLTRLGSKRSSWLLFIYLFINE